MKLEFDPKDPLQLKAAHAAIVILMGSAPAPTKAAASTPTTASSPATVAPTTATTATAPSTDTAASVTASGGTADLATASKAMQDFVMATKAPARAKEILTANGVKALKDASPEQMGAIVAAFQAAMAG